MNKIKILGKVSNKIIKNLGFTFNNYFNVFFIDFSEVSIPIDTEFNTIISSRGNTTSCKINLVRITQQFGKEFKEIPEGWKTIVELEILEPKPKILKEMPFINDWYESKSFCVLEARCLKNV